mgnify:CR=1 FL=1
MAVLGEPLSVALHAVRLGEVYPAARVAIFGCGPIGLSVLLCAKVQAPCTVSMTDLLEPRVALARQCGADLVVHAAQTDPVAALCEHEPFGFDLVFECSGDPACIGQAAALLTPGGVLVQVGIPGSPHIEIDPHTFRVKELSVRNVRRQKGCVAPVLRMMAEGHIDAAPLIIRSAKKRILLSGIREIEADAVADTFIQLGCREISRDGDGQWCGLVLDLVRS